MKLLLDTHALLWLASGDARLSQPARNAIADSANTLTISVATIWELAIKTTKPQQPLMLIDPLDVYLAKCLPTYGIDVLAIQQAHALSVLELPHHHRDPFDRIMIAQAI
ncbi:MAG TPA: type II toxin-antitoxin system VapC family toxin [Planctomycetaceae bacterium]|nr:type II toxin-antitoxin system VapC family toxin [Planctomycetaceae bacterium]